MLYGLTVQKRRQRGVPEFSPPVRSGQAKLPDFQFAYALAVADNPKWRMNEARSLLELRPV